MAANLSQFETQKNDHPNFNAFCKTELRSDALRWHSYFGSMRAWLYLKHADQDDSIHSLVS